VTFSESSLFVLFLGCDGGSWDEMGKSRDNEKSAKVKLVLNLVLILNFFSHFIVIFVMRFIYMSPWLGYHEQSTPTHDINKLKKKQHNNRRPVR